jgi:hypothetical protein
MNRPSHVCTHGCVISVKFCGQIDLLKQFQMMREIGTIGIIRTHYDNDVCITNLQKKAYIVATQMSTRNSLPFGMDPSLSVDKLFCPS